jgi:hypothetical protein
VKPDGSAIDNAVSVTGPNWLSGNWVSVKDSATGTYTIKLLKGDGSVYKQQSFTLGVADFAIEFVPADFTYEGNVIDTANEDVQRTMTVKSKFFVEYAGGPIATHIDLPSGFKVSVFYNTTKVADIALDPITAFDVATNKWSVSWKIPKDAVKGINYGFNLTLSSIVDSYGNYGPQEDYASTGDQINFFEVVNGVLKVTSSPSLIYPGVGSTLQRTLSASAYFEVKYPDGTTRVATDDFQWVNATVYSASKSYNVVLAASDYNSTLGLWIAKWAAPYDAPIASDYKFKIGANSIKDKYGNKGPSSATGDSLAFGVGKATLAVSGLVTDKAVYASSDQMTAAFAATYPSGAAVTTGTAKITFSGTGMTAVDKDAT